MSYDEIQKDPVTYKIVTNLKNKIDQLGIMFSTVREYVFELAKYLDEEKKCERDEICTLIKNLFADKVKERKLSDQWIEDCLPKEYKRKYVKSELTSHSGTISCTNDLPQIYFKLELTSLLIHYYFYRIYCNISPLHVNRYEK